MQLVFKLAISDLARLTQIVSNSVLAMFSNVVQCSVPFGLSCKQKKH